MHGRHIKVVGEGASTLLGNPEVIRNFLCELVKELGMQALCPPIVHDVEIDISKIGREPFEDEGGVTGIIVLSTSHCSIHTWPARENPEFVLDVYSCRQFDATDVAALCRGLLGSSRLALTDVSDSLKGPREIDPTARDVWRMGSYERQTPMLVGEGAFKHDDEITSPGGQ